MSAYNTKTGPVPKLAGATGSANSAIRRLEAHRRLRQANLRRYWRLKNAEQYDHIPTQAEHGWGIRFVRAYPRQCATCGCQTRSPFDDTMIMHDVDGCQPPLSPNTVSTDK